MPHRSDEQLFAAFQRHRDCQALGLVFHRRADELLRLAVFLAPRPSDAEDLVQATFLSAIARAETFRPGHRVMSWLCGILTNHARMLRRASKRQPPQANDAVAEDPFDAALRSELRSALAAGIAGLSEPYRSVVSLHLEDGLGHREISERLARPPATVRKQMERALERLRGALPLGLATAVVSRLDAQAIARQAADAARYVEPVATGPGAAHTVTAPWRGALAALAAAAGLALAAGAIWWQWPAVAPALPVASSGAVPAATAPDTNETRTAATPPASAVAPHAEEPADRIAAAPAMAPPSGALVVNVLEANGEPLPDFEVWLVADDGRALPERVLGGAFASARSDADGRAAFASLAAGHYDLAWPGAVAKRHLQIGDNEQRCDLVVPPAVACTGVVLDLAGNGIGDAEVVFSETSLRGDLGAVAGRTRSDGSFAATARLATGRVFARHADFAAGVGVRIEAERRLRLVLPPARRAIDVRVCDEHGAALPAAYVALVPRSFAMSLCPPQHSRCNDDGRCRLGDPGPREATVLASVPGFAPTTTDLPLDASVLEVRLGTGGKLRGRLTDERGAALVDHEVTASVADQRSNEPVSPLIARLARTGPDGSFAFANLPSGSVQVRAYGPLPAASGLLPLPNVLAAADVDVTSTAPSELELTARAGPVLRGRLVTPNGAGVAGWNVVAAPVAGTALHRGFRSRGAPTDAAGNFVIRDLAAGEDYQLGAFLPGAPRRRDANFPFAFATARPGGSVCMLVVDPTALSRTRLRCRVLAPNGQPCPGAELEVRALRFQSPTTKTADEAGGAEFGPLAPGDYWLAIAAPGLGTRTVAFAIAAGADDLDLGAITLQPGARLDVHVHGLRGAVPAGIRVVGRSTLGDKFVEALTDAQGIASLPALPPGDTHLLVHGPGVAPLQRVLALGAGAQVLDVEVSPATTVPMQATFCLADNPFTVNGPLHVRVHDADDRLVFEDFVGAVSARGSFDLTTGLPPGRYRVTARAVWNARAEAEIVVGAESPAPIQLRLSR